MKALTLFTAISISLFLSTSIFAQVDSTNLGGTVVIIQDIIVTPKGGSVVIIQDKNAQEEEQEEIWYLRSEGVLPKN